MSTSSTALAEVDFNKVMTDLGNELSAAIKQPGASNTKLSESRLRLAAIAALPTNFETTITLKEAFKGTCRSYTVKDQNVCTSCINTKPINRLHCAECKGLGYTISERQVEVIFEAGLTDNQEIRHSGLGAFDIRSGKNGDLIVKIKISEHEHLKIEDTNIKYNCKVSLYEATLGGQVEVPTATGKVVMKLAPLTRPGSVYRLKGLGMAGGDQLVTIEVTMPEQLTSEQVRLFQKIKEIADRSIAEKSLVSIN